LTVLQSTKLLRMFIYNSYENQAPFYHTENYSANLEPPSWTLRIEGHLLDSLESTLPGGRMPPTGSRTTKKKFSRFFRKIFIQLDKELYYPNDTIEWDKSESGVDTDGFEIKRQGDQETTVKIFLHLDYSPTRFKLSPPLAQLLNIHTETRARVTHALWQYIKMYRLQDPDDRRLINNDEALAAVFNCSKMEISALPRLISEHLGPPDPIEIEYTIRCTGEIADYREVYDVEVEVEEVSGTFSRPDVLPSSEQEALDEQIGKLVGQIRQRCKRREFMTQFHHSPTASINRLVAAQIHDFQTLQTDGTGGTSPFEEERTANFFYQPLVLKAVERFASQGQENV
jgi:SWI/SNF-related matrix-associated actin-dependent regulator of chromatin subfamily D